jgi:dTDP-4-amino-4,6-dideoxygalactose transaminase
MTQAIPFIDLKAQRQRLGGRIDEAVLRVVNHGAYIMGPEIAELEAQLADYCGVRHAIGCASGTDALILAMLAYGVGPGDAVFVPAFTFVATAEPVALFGAAPFFVDVERDNFNISADSLTAAIAEAKGQGLRPRGVIPVDLFGLPADYDAIGSIAAEHGLFVISDTAQGFGGSRNGRRAGAFGDIATTSFFPAKPLGCYGDGGAVFTDDDELAEAMRSIRVHGQGENKYDNVRLGINGRLDTMQAAVLIEKLSIFDDELAARDRIAQRYSNGLGNHVTVPRLPDGCTSAWAQYTILLDQRDRVAAELKAQGIPTAIYYPIPLNQQTGYRDYPTIADGAPNSQWLAERVLSLPMHPYLDEETQTRIIAAVVGSVQNS